MASSEGQLETEYTFEIVPARVDVVRDLLGRACSAGGDSEYSLRFRREKRVVQLLSVDGLKATRTRDGVRHRLAFEIGEGGSIRWKYTLKSYRGGRRFEGRAAKGTGFEEAYECSRRMPPVDAVLYKKKEDYWCGPRTAADGQNERVAVAADTSRAICMGEGPVLGKPVYFLELEATKPALDGLIRSEWFVSRFAEHLSPLRHSAFNRVQLCQALGEPLLFRSAGEFAALVRSMIDLTACPAGDVGAR